MSETKIAAAALVAEPAGKFAEHLAGRFASSRIAVEFLPYNGVLTPVRLDAPDSETGAVFFGAAVYDLSWQRRIAVRGEDRFRWLSGMVTNGVETLAKNYGAYNLVLNAQGRIQGDAHVWHTTEALELEVAADQQEALMAHFDRFIIMDDVELIPLRALSAIGLTGPTADAVLAELGVVPIAEEMTCLTAELRGIRVEIRRTHGTLAAHYELWTGDESIVALWDAVVAAGARPVGAAAVESLRIVEGIPAYGIDIQSRDLVQETSQMRAVSFSKGCYLGQEIVERIRSRGQVHRHLRSVEIFPEGPTTATPEAGTEIHFSGEADAKPAGTLTSRTSVSLAKVRRNFGIAMIRAEAEIGDRALHYPGGTVRILPSPPKLTAA